MSVTWRQEVFLFSKRHQTPTAAQNDTQTHTPDTIEQHKKHPTAAQNKLSNTKQHQQTQTHN